MEPENLLKLEAFLPLVGSAFRVELDQPVELKLISATPLTLHEPLETRPDIARRRIPFSLLFVGDARIILPQRIYRMENDVLGALDIFLVPIGRDAGGTQYEAIFN